MPPQPHSERVRRLLALVWPGVVQPAHVTTHRDGGLAMSTDKYILLHLGIS